MILHLPDQQQLASAAWWHDFFFLLFCWLKVQVLCAHKHHYHYLVVKQHFDESLNYCITTHNHATSVHCITQKKNHLFELRVVQIKRLKYSTHIGFFCEHIAQHLCQ